MDSPQDDPPQRAEEESRVKESDFNGSRSLGISVKEAGGVSPMRTETTLYAATCEDRSVGQGDYAPFSAPLSPFAPMVPRCVSLQNRGRLLANAARA
jgi:hypothetical protein